MNRTIIKSASGISGMGFDPMRSPFGQPTASSVSSAPLPAAFNPSAPGSGPMPGPRKAQTMDPMTGAVTDRRDRRPGDTGPALGGNTFFDVANFGKYEGHGQGNGQGGEDGYRIGNSHGPAPTPGSLAPFYQKNPDLKPLNPAMMPTQGPPSGALPAPGSLDSFYAANPQLKPMNLAMMPTQAPRQPVSPELQKQFEEAGKKFADPMFDGKGRGLYLADGGRPPTGEVVMVGERGPELAVFDKPATIVPNHMLQNPDKGIRAVISEYGGGSSANRDIGQISPEGLMEFTRNNATMGKSLEPGATNGVVNVGGVKVDPAAGLTDAQWKYLQAQEQQTLNRMSQAPANAPVTTMPAPPSIIPTMTPLPKPEGVRNSDWRQFLRSEQGVAMAANHEANQRAQASLPAPKTPEEQQAEREQAMLGTLAATVKFGVLPPETQTWIGEAKTPAERSGRMEAALQFGDAALKQKFELETDKKKKEMNAQWERDNPDTPKPWALDVPGVPGQKIFGVNKNVMGSVDTNKPKSTELTAEEVADLEAKGYSVTRKVGDSTIKKQGSKLLELDLDGSGIKKPYREAEDGSLVPVKVQGTEGGGGASSGSANQSRSASRFGAALGAGPAPQAVATAPPAPTQITPPSAPAAYVPKAQQQIMSQQSAAQQKLNQAWTAAKDTVTAKINPDVLLRAARTSGMIPTGRKVPRYTGTMGSGAAVTMEDEVAPVAVALLRENGIDPDSTVEIGGRRYTQRQILEARFQELTTQR